MKAIALTPMRRPASSDREVCAATVDAASGAPIAGLVKTSLLDYPGAICSTIFLAGCNLRCPYCHNKDLVAGASRLPGVPLTEVRTVLLRRRGFIDGVCITGGEPTLTPALPALARAMKDLGMKVKLDTNGTNPDVVRNLLDEGLVDYIAMDVKAPRWKYQTVTRVPVDLQALQATIGLLMASGVEHEFRTTVVPRLLTETDLHSIGEWLDGAGTYVLQQFRPENTLEAEYGRVSACPSDWLHLMAGELRHRFGQVIVRGGCT